MRAFSRLRLPAFLAPALSLAILSGCGPTGGDSAGPQPVDVAKLGEPVKGAEPIPVPAAVPAPPTQEDRKFRDDALRIATEIGKIPPSPAAAREGLEAAEGWRLADWEDPGTNRRIEVGRGGNVLLHLSTAGGDKGKTGLLLTRDMSLADKGAMRVTAYNPGTTPVRLAVAFWCADSWVYYESLPQDLEAGAWKTLSFDLAAGDFKTKSSDWKHTASLWKRETTKQLAVLLFAGGKSGAIFIDGIAVDLGAAPARPADGVQNPLPRRPGMGRGRRAAAPPPPEKKAEEPKVEQPAPAAPTAPAETKPDKPAAEPEAKAKEEPAPAKPAEDKAAEAPEAPATPEGPEAPEAGGAEEGE